MLVAQSSCSSAALVGHGVPLLANTNTVTSRLCSAFGETLVMSVFVGFCAYVLETRRI